LTSRLEAMLEETQGLPEPLWKQWEECMVGHGREPTTIETYLKVGST